MLILKKLFLNYKKSKLIFKKNYIIKLNMIKKKFYGFILLII